LEPDTPLANLSHWRIDLASLLRNDRMTVGAISEQIGDESGAAFSKAFKRRFGVAPGAYRHQPSRVA